MAEPAALGIEDLVAREEIGDVIKRLARGTDRLDEEMMASCDHPDGVDDHNVFRGSGREFARWVVETLAWFEATMHFVGAPLVRRDGDVAQVDTQCVAHHLSRPDEAGRRSDMVLGLRYVDRFERRDGRWRIARRVCAFDWSYSVPSQAGEGFRFEPGWTLGARDRSDVAYRGV